MNEDEDLDQEFVNYVEDRTDNDYDKDEDEPYGAGDLEKKPAKREDSDFWAARGKKEDTNFWATRG